MPEETPSGGWKTKTAAVGAMLTGAGMILQCVAGESFSMNCVLEGGLVFLGGAAVFGLRDAIGKLIAVLQNLK